MMMHGSMTGMLTTAILDRHARENEKGKTNPVNPATQKIEESETNPIDPATQRNENAPGVSLLFSPSTLRAMRN
jgi:hypothetical protein